MPTRPFLWMKPGMMPILHSPGVMMPGHLGPMRRVPEPASDALTRTMSLIGIPSVMHTTSSMPASAASRMASAANAAGTYMTLAVAPVCFMASATVTKTGRSRCFSPPRPGVTPPTIFVPYLMLCSELYVPCWPVKPWQITLVFLFTRMLIECYLGLFRGRDGFLRGVGEVGGGCDGKRAVREHLTGLLGVRAFEAHDDGHGYTHLLH